MKKILAAVDFSDMAREAVARAATIALGTNAELVLLYVAPENPDYIGFKSLNQNEREELADVLQKEHHQLQEISHHLSEQGVNAKSMIIQGDVVDTILEEASKINAELIVMGSHGYTGLAHALLGSISEGVLRKTTRPLLIVPYDTKRSDTEK